MRSPVGARAVEHVEVRLFERAGDLDRAVAAEVEEHHTVAVDDLADRRAVVIHHHELSEVLVAGVRLVVHGLDGCASVRKRATLAVHVASIAALDHVPVGLVAVHRDLHPATAGGDPEVTTVTCPQLISARTSSVRSM